MNAPHFSITTLFQQLNKVSNECSLRQVYASRCYSLCRSIASFNCPDRSIAFMVSGQIKSQIQANTSHKRRWSNTILKHKSQAQVKHKWPNTILKQKSNTSHEHETNQCTAVGNLSSALAPAAPPATCNDRGRIISVAIGNALVANLPNCLRGQS